MNHRLRNMLDCDVTLYVGPHVLKGSIGETEHEDVVVLHTDAGMAEIRIEQVSAFIVHPYKAD